MGLPDLSISRPLAIMACCLALIATVALRGVGELVLFAAVAIILLISGAARKSTLRWSEGRALPDIAMGLAVGTAYALVENVAIYPLVEHLLNAQPDLSSFAAVHGNLKAALVLVAIAWIIGGLLEEISYRGFLIGWGSDLLGSKAEIPLLLLASTVFGAVHLYQGAAGAISTGLAGLLFGLLYLWRGKTLLAAIIAHGAYDTIGIAFLYLGWGLS